MHKRVFTQAFVVVGAIIEQEGKILLIRELEGHDKGKWNQPAGWVDPGEDLLAAVKREIKEETGLEFEPTAIVGIYSIVKERLKSKIEAGVPHGIKIIYKGTVSGAIGNFVDEVAEVNWFDPHEIENMNSEILRDEDIKQEVKDYLSGVAYPLNLIHHTIQK